MVKGICIACWQVQTVGICLGGIRFDEIRSPLEMGHLNENLSRLPLLSDHSVQITAIPRWLHGPSKLSRVMAVQTSAEEELIGLIKTVLAD